MKKLILKIFFSFLLISLAGNVSAQHPWIYIGEDTIACDSVPLVAKIDTLWHTGDYAISTIPFAPDTLTFPTSSGIDSDDEFSAVIPLDFTFCFYGNSYNQAVISSNNFLSFDLTNASGGSTWATVSIPTTTPVDIRNAIMGPWQDIHPGVGGTITYQTMGVAPLRRFVVSYNEVPMFSCTGLLYSSQIIVYETTNIIETHIENKPLCTTWNSGNAVHGLHNASGTAAITVSGRNNTNYTIANEGVRFTPNELPFIDYEVNWYNNGNYVGSGDQIMIIRTNNLVDTIIGEVIYHDDCTNNNPAFYDTLYATVKGVSFDIINPSCFGSDDASITVSINSPASSTTYLWSTGDTVPTIDSLSVGNYAVIVDDGVCHIEDSVSLIEPSIINTDLFTTDDSCRLALGSAWWDNPSGGRGMIYTHEWLPSGDTTDTITGLLQGDYILTVTDSSGCVREFYYTVEGNAPDAGFTSVPTDDSNDTIFIDTEIYFTDTTFTHDYLLVSWWWDFGDGNTSNQQNPMHIYLDTGTFDVTLIVVNVDGCSDTAVVTYHVLKPKSPVTTVNIITPDGDGINDVFFVDWMLDYKVVQLVIYNRWGKKVYESNQYSQDWDGHELSAGVYYYIVRYGESTFSLKEQFGSLTLSK